MRIHFTDWSTGWDERNDYSAQDKLPPEQWALTDQIRLYNETGELIYGWQMR